MRFSALDVLFFAWEVHGRGFRAQVICVLRFNWPTYRLAGTSLERDIFPKRASGLSGGHSEKPGRLEPDRPFVYPATATERLLWRSFDVDAADWAGQAVTM